MTISLIVVLFALLALLGILRLAKGQAIRPQAVENPAAYLRAVDIDAFRNLSDPSEEAFLRANMERREFRRVQRERLHATLEYVSGVANNAAVLLRVAEVARRNPDVETAKTAEKLIDTAIRLRLYALRAMGSLYVGMLLPGVRISSGQIAERYELMTRQVVMLGLHHPIRGASASL